jgi:hypothetical protein
MLRCPTGKRPGAFNAHSPGDGGSGLVQPVFRSPARIPAAESTRRGLCAAPPSEKRYTLTLYAITRMILNLDGFQSRRTNGGSGIRILDEGIRSNGRAEVWDGTDDPILPSAILIPSVIKYPTLKLRQRS